MFAVETSWPEEFILIWLPLARAEQYYHALLRRANWRTYARPDLAPDQQVEAIEAQTTEALPWSLPSADLDAVWARFDAQK